LQQIFFLHKQPNYNQTLAHNMTNPYTQPSEYVSTRTNWFNPNGVAHYTRPVSQPSVEEATTNMVEAAIANKQQREAEAEDAQARAQAAYHQAQAYAQAQAQAQAAQAASHAAAQAATARRTQEIRHTVERVLRRTERAPSTDAERREREQWWNAFHARGPPTPPPSAPPVEAHAHCGFDHCNGLCTFLRDP
jgi:hypothetical protein